ncbi:hypothetical protein XENOCAPTIV_021992 [Xenoophorus captivus]|uniref:Uncharacterized protein n=1 Tax=Xenoophorus captivus TaxID=1517983 RepID=A0ABV0QT18_9TELE
MIPQEWRSTYPSLVYPSTLTSECYDEQLSDKCLTLLLGTWKMNGTPCIVTKPCRDTMTHFGCPHYSLSHQLLYFMIGRMRGCNNLLKGDTRASRTNMTEQNYQDIFCSNMMKANQDIIANGLTEQTVDIFIENIMICGLAGFSDFHKTDWLQHILRLQDDEVGCFGRDKSFISQVIGDELLEQLQPHRRVKRREKILPGLGVRAGKCYVLGFDHLQTAYVRMLLEEDFVETDQVEQRKILFQPGQIKTYRSVH